MCIRTIFNTLIDLAMALPPGSLESVAFASKFRKAYAVALLVMSSTCSSE